MLTLFIILFVGGIFFSSLAMALMAKGISSANNGKDYRNYHQINAIRHNYDTRNENVNWDLFKN